MMLVSGHKLGKCQLLCSEGINIISGKCIELNFYLLNSELIGRLFAGGQKRNSILILVTATAAAPAFG